MHLIMTRMGPNSNGCQRHGAWLWLARDSCCRDKQCKDRKRKTILQRIHGQNYVKNIQHIGSEKIRYVNIFLIFHSQLDDVKFCLCHASLQLSLLIGSERRGGGGGREQSQLSRVDAMRGLEFVVGSHPSVPLGFFFGPSGFHPSTKTNFRTLQFHRKQWIE